MKFLPMLKQFRDERGLTEYNHDAFMRMVNEELGEVLEAKTWSHRIEEMCDVCVLCFNGLEQENASTELEPEMFDEHADFEVAVSDAKRDVERGFLDYCIESMRDCIVLNGYDFELAMIETCKKILSRTGEMNHETGKWEKHKLQANPYTPDYESCKLK